MPIDGPLLRSQANDIERLIDIQRRCATGRRRFGERQRGGEGKLLPGDAVFGRRPGGSLRLNHLQQQPDLFRSLRQGQAIAQRQLRLALRDEIEGGAAAGDGFAR